MRIVAGKHKGRAIEAGNDKAVRPTADRTREAMFNILAHNTEFRTASGQMPHGARVLDLFAGSGALGLEAISRGAVHATFIDDRPESIKLVRSNAATLLEIRRCTILQRDAQMPGRAPAPCTLAFLDPPYKAGLAGPALHALVRDEWLTEDAVVVIEIGAKETFIVPEEFTLDEDRNYGAARLLFLKRHAEPPA